MSRLSWKPGNMLYPLPAVLVTCTNGRGEDNVLTVAWTGTICSDPAMLSISVRPERYSYAMIKETGEFVINLATKELTRALDYCGVRSGRDVDKYQEMHLTVLPSKIVGAPGILESPVNIECRVTKREVLGSHDLFLAEVKSVTVDDRYMNENGKFELNQAGLITYSHGEYFELGKKIGSFGYSVRKPGNKKARKKKR